MIRLQTVSAVLALVSVATIVGPAKAEIECDVVEVLGGLGQPAPDSPTSLTVGSRQLIVSYDGDWVKAGDFALANATLPQTTFGISFVDGDDQPLPIREFEVDVTNFFNGGDTVVRALDLDGHLVDTVTAPAANGDPLTVLLTSGSSNRIARIEMDHEIGSGFLISNLVVCMETDPVEAAIDSIDDLIELVATLNLARGIENSLDAKLDHAFNILQDAMEQNDQAAFNSIQAFINAVEAQRGNKITDADADLLIAAALQVLIWL